MRPMQPLCIAQAQGQILKGCMNSSCIRYLSHAGFPDKLSVLAVRKGHHDSTLTGMYAKAYCNSASRLKNVVALDDE